MTRRSDAARGSMSAEIVILVPTLMAMVLFTVHVGRVQTAVQFTKHVADVSARSGTRSSDSRAEQVARSRAVLEMERSPGTCESFWVSVSTRERDGARMLTTEVRCRTRAGGLSMLGVRGPVVHVSSSEVFDRYRGAP
jgi:hypothetical protein